MAAQPNANEKYLLPKACFDDLLRLLSGDGYEVIGPRIDQGAIVYAPLASAKDLPIGWTERQGPGTYRLEKRADQAYFGYAVGPHSWKKYLFPPLLRLFQARRNGQSFEVSHPDSEPPRRAFLGVRACELQALAVQDRAFIGRREGDFRDPHYAQARDRLLLIAVECEHSGGTCFCASMNTGPEVKTERIALPLAQKSPNEPVVSRSPVDVVLTELDEAFVARAVSSAGQSLLQRLGLTPAAEEEIQEGQRRVAEAARSMGRTVDVTDVRNLLHRNQEHPRWQNVADRCLACTNCTLVCPTCFCSSISDSADLNMENAERIRRWDSCFNPEFAQVHGGNFRPTIRGRYRQWLTHKFASWFDQFDVSGCVGCGRCITWCPVGIDVTEEITAIRATDGQKEVKTP